MVIRSKSERLWPYFLFSKLPCSKILRPVQTDPTLLGVVSTCCVRLHGPKSLTGFKLYATSANIVVVPCKRTQQVTTLLGPTMLGIVGQQCWVRLHGPLLRENLMEWMILNSSNIMIWTVITRAWLGELQITCCDKKDPVHKTSPILSRD